MRSAVPVLAVAGVVVPVLIVAAGTFSAEPRTPPAARPVALGAPSVSGTGAATATASDPGLAADTELCLAVSAAVQDAALAVEQQDRLPRATLVARLQSAEAEIGRHRDEADSRLGAASRAMQQAIAGLRHAVEAGGAIAVATDVALDRIDELDAACQARLHPGAAGSRP